MNVSLTTFRECVDRPPNQLSRPRLMSLCRGALSIAFTCAFSLTMDGVEVVAPAVPAMETIHNTLLEMRAMCDGHIFGMVSMINY